MAEKEYKTLDEWRVIYREKEKLIAKWGYPEVTSKEFYRDIFPKGSLQRKDESESNKGNIVANNMMKTRNRITIIYDDLEDLDKLMGSRFGLIGPFTCFGRSYKQEFAHKLYALAIDIDYVDTVHLKRLFREFENWENKKPNSWMRMPPTYLVSSGRGIHLYYLLKEPIDMYKHRAEKLTELKMALVKYMWNESTSYKPDIDKSSIYQCFRCVGCLSKLCLDKERENVVTRDYPVKAYKISDRRFTLEEIRDSIEGCKIDLSSLYEKPKNLPNKASLEEAKDLWPEWYDRRIIKNEPKKLNKKTWVCNPALYDWWIQKVLNEAKVGGRYFTIVALCCYGRKCGISDGKIRKDAWKLYDHLESITDDEANHFTRQDMRDALSILNDDAEMKLEHTRQWISDKTKIEIKPAKRRKKPLKRDDGTAYKAARMIQDLQDPDGNWRNKDGRPEKQQMVQEWRKQHPDGNKIECERETGLSRHTVLKWWNENA